MFASIKRVPTATYHLKQVFKQLILIDYAAIDLEAEATQHI